MHDRPFVVVRENPRPGRPHPYDVVLDWIAENFPEYLPLFRLAALPFDLGEADFSLHVAWLNDPVQAYSMELYNQATKLAADCDARGIPLINRVDRLHNATKLLGASLIAEAGVRVPRMARIGSAEEFRDTLCGMPLPLIVREDWGHQGELLRVNTKEEAQALPLDRFARPIAVELVDVRDRRDGYYRKYRYFAIGDLGVASHLQISRDWITRGDARVVGDNARYEELDYIGRPDPNHLVLQHARRALGLDYVAFDYGYDPDDRVVVWEANPYPYLHFSTKSLVYRNASMHRTLAGILKLYLERAGMLSPERLDALLDYTRPPSTTWTGRAPMAVPLRERLALREMRCAAEFALDLGPDEDLSLEAPSAPIESIMVLSRNEKGQAVRVPLNHSSGQKCGWSLAIDTRGPLLLTILIDETVAAANSTTVTLVRCPKGTSPTTLDDVAGRKSNLYLASAIIVKSEHRGDQLRIRTTLNDATRFCLAAVTLDGSRVDGLPFSTPLKAYYRYVDLAAGATLIPNPFADAGEYVVFLTPWSSGDRDAYAAAITGFEAFRVSGALGAHTGEEKSAHPIAKDLLAPDNQALWTLNEAHEAHVSKLIDVARKTASDEVRQAAVDRLVELNRCPDSLISRRGVNARAASSFRRALLTWSRKTELQRSGLGLEKALEWRAKDKDEGYRLAGLLGANLLERHGPLSMAEALSRAAHAMRPVVVKPIGAAGSWGVFVVHKPDAILNLRQRQWIANIDVLAGEMARLAWDRWLVEDFAENPDDPLCPAADLKFYAFYGRIGIALEVERYPTTRYAFWLRDGTPTRTGHYADQLFEGRGVTADQFEAVEALSAQLPFPFMRIDLLRSKDKLFFGEFTPRPGDFEQFSPGLDFLLGDLFLEAELRLTRDLLNGKRFPAFMEWATPFLGGDQA